MMVGGGGGGYLPYFILTKYHSNENGKMVLRFHDEWVVG